MTTSFRTIVEGIPVERQERIRKRSKDLLARIRLAAVTRAALAILLTSWGCGEGPPDASTADRPDPADWPTDPRVDAIVQDVVEPGEPGLAVLVLRDGEVVHASGYGLADVQSGRPFETETPTRLGSVTKPFVSWAVMRLVEMGELSYDDPVASWLPELDRFPGVTVRHLLTHTSGIPDYYGFDGFNEAIEAADGVRVFANEDAMEIYRSWGEPEFRPGERHEYSNPGYEALALLVERVAGTDLGEFMNRELFAPLGMETAAFRMRPSTVIPDRAIGYAPDSTGTGWVEEDHHPANWLIGAGGMYASLADFVRFDSALSRWDAEGRMEEAFTPAVLLSGDTVGYALGWTVTDQPFGPLVGHSGSWVGFRTMYFHFRDGGFSIVVLSNSSRSVDALTTRIVREVYFPSDGAE